MSHKVEVHPASCWGVYDWYDVTVAGISKLTIASHAGGRYGVYKYMHEPALYEGENLDDAKKWAIEECENADSSPQQTEVEA